MNETAIRETESEEGTFLHANNIDDALCMHVFVSYTVYSYKFLDRYQ